MCCARVASRRMSRPYANAVMGSRMYAVVAIFSPTEDALSELLDFSATEPTDGHIFVARADRMRGVGHIISSPMAVSGSAFPIDFAFHEYA